MANLFTGQTPAVTNADDGAPGILLATGLQFAAAGQVTGIRFWATTTVSGTYTAQLYRATAGAPAPGGSLLASKVASVAPTGGGWNTVAFDSPVDVSPGMAYQACLHSSAGRYVATNGFFGAPLSNGDITAYANNTDPLLLGSLSQGSFLISATPGYPTSSGGGTSYFVDVEFTAAGAGVITPTSVPLAARAGHPAMTLAGVAPPSTAPPARVGTPSVATPAPEPLDTRPAGWNSFGAVLASARADAQVNAERRAHPVECPDHGWPLQPTSRGLHCQFGGHIVRGS